MTQSTIDNFDKDSGVKRQEPQEMTDWQLINYATKHGGPDTLLILACYNKSHTYKIKNGKKKKIITVEAGNTHYLDLLWWRYKHNKIEV